MSPTTHVSTIQSPRFITQHDHPCRKCGGTPTRLLVRGPIMMERHCIYCGAIEYLDHPLPTG